MLGGLTILKPGDQWSCKRSPDIWAYYKYKNKFRKIWHCRKIGQGQLRVIIYINFVEFRYIMLHAKFQDHKTISSIGKDFWRFLSYMGMAAILVNYIYFLSPFPRRLQMKFGVEWPSGFREEDV